MDASSRHQPRCTFGILDYKAPHIDTSIFAGLPHFWYLHIFSSLADGVSHCRMNLLKHAESANWNWSLKGKRFLKKFSKLLFFPTVGNESGRQRCGGRGEKGSSGLIIRQEGHTQVAAVAADLTTQLSAGTRGHQRIFNWVQSSTPSPLHVSGNL